MNGEVYLPGDKSVAHRAIILASLLNAKSKIGNIPHSQDIFTTINVLSQCGIESLIGLDSVKIFGGTFKEPQEILNCSGSGTTARLITGLLCGLNYNFCIDGDDSLSKRPMGRLLEHLRQVGACLQYDGKLPIISISSGYM